MCWGAQGKNGAPIQRVLGRGKYSSGSSFNHPRRKQISFRQIIPLSGFSPKPSTSGDPKGNLCGLKLLLLNARSVNNKISLIRDLTLDENADIICITETWLDAAGGVNLSQLCPPGFQILHQPRLQGRGGGVALIVRDSIPVSKHPAQQCAGSEYLHVTLQGQDRLDILLIYRSPCGPSTSLLELSTMISTVALDSSHLLVLGDFNVHADAPESAAAQDFMAAMATMGLSQWISAPTHMAGHTLDLVFTGGHRDSGLDMEETKITPLSWSDHYLVSFRLAAFVHPFKVRGLTGMVRPRRLMDPSSFLMTLGNFPASRAGDSPDALTALWYRESTRALDQIAPERPRPSRRAKTAPWFTEELRAMKRLGRRLERQWRKTREESDRAQAIAHFRAYSMATMAAKKASFSATIASATNRPAELFRVVRELLHTNPPINEQECSTDRCNEFARHFADKIDRIRHDLDSAPAPHAIIPTPSINPIIMDSFQPIKPEEVDRILSSLRPSSCLLDPCPAWLVRTARTGLADWMEPIVNASLREGVMPSILKNAIVRPLLKKPSLDPTNLNNYRPVSNLPFLGKVIERVVATQLQEFLEETDYLDPFQSGFRPGFGTETALVALTDDLLRGLDKGNASLLVLLDLSAAFDTIDHSILLDRLARLGLKGTALKWFDSFLANRSQMVMLGDACSACWPLQYGVPQGSILSPMLFNIYMKPLGEIIRRFGVGCHQYADDTQLYLSLPSQTKEAVKVLGLCLEAVGVWMKDNRLRLNPEKTEVLLVKKSSMQALSCSPTLNGVTLPLQEQVRSLGVLLDSQLSLENQVAAVARNAFAQLRLVRQLRPYLSRSDLATVVHALVISKMDYCNSLYVGLPSRILRKLQLVQNAAARVVTGASRLDSAGPLLQQLKWLPIHLRSQFKMLILTFKALHDLGPAYLKNRLLPYIPSRPLRSSKGALLQVPPLSQVKGMAARGRAFSVKAPQLWNSLPEELRSTHSLLAFRRGLKSYLSHLAFE